MASAIGTALISTILQPMVDKAMGIIEDKGLKIMEDRAMEMAVDNIEREISRLQTTLYMIQDIVQVAEEKQIDKPTVFIQNWLRNLVDIAYEARDVLDDFNTFSSCIITAGEASNPVNFISSFIMKYVGGSSSDTSNIPLTVLNRLEKDIRSVRERFDVMIKEGRDFMTFISGVGGGGSKSVKNRRPEVGPEDNKQGDGLFLGREDVKKGIIDKILEPKYERVDVVVIWGMGGIGKTTLAQSIYNDERVKIVPRSWSCVGVNKFSAEKVIREILNDQNTIGIGNLQTKLKEKLKGDRFLIVLDDVWDVDGSEWDLLFNPLDNVGKGGMIIITRREKEVRPALINIQTAYNLQPLSEEDSWSIFESCAYVNGKADSTSDLKGIGEKIVKKLNGHPLALKVVGRSLLNKDSSTWKKFLESKLTKGDVVMSSLRWSYNHLPPHLKTCFTYCSLFPKDHVFYNEKLLVQMWMAHDLLIQKEEQKRRPEDVGAQYFTELVNASLLQCVDGKYTMHDLIHDLALLVSNGEFATDEMESLTKDQMKKVRHVTIRSGGEYSKVPRLCKMEKLLTLYTTHHVYDRYVRLDDVFKQLKSIRVLVLDSRKITDIPDCISELRHLRYLDVSGTRVQSLPDSLCHLYNLQMLAAPLDAALPKDIVNISSLRYVRASLSTCKGVGKLTSLQELSSIHVCEGDNIRELGDIQILRGRLWIRGLGNVEKLEDDVGALMEKQTLLDELVLHFEEQLEKSTISEKVLDALGCPPNLTCLQIYGYTGVKFPSHQIHKLSSLEKLLIYRCPQLQSLPPDFHKLSSLEGLYINDCPQLQSLPPDFHKLSSLEGLDIIICPQLQSLPPDFHKLSSLESLSIEQCPQLQSLPPDFHKLSSLETLWIIKCPQLQSLPPHFHKLSSLKTLTIFDCSQLQSLPVDGLPPSLTYLEIMRCPLLYERCKDEFGLDWHKINHIPVRRIR